MADNKYQQVRDIVNDLLEDIELSDGRKGTTTDVAEIIRLLIIGLRD